jgi:flap endonuclease-1
LNSEERVRRGADKLQKFLNSKQQGRLDGFFSVKPKEKEKATVPAKGKGTGKDKVDTKAKGSKRKVCCKNK